jgi:hypothetical protein
MPASGLIRSTSARLQMGHEPSPRLGDCEGSTAVVRGGSSDVGNWHISSVCSIVPYDRNRSESRLRRTREDQGRRKSELPCLRNRIDDLGCPLGGDNRRNFYLWSAMRPRWSGSALCWHNPLTACWSSPAMARCRWDWARSRRSAHKISRLQFSTTAATARPAYRRVIPALRSVCPRSHASAASSRPFDIANEPALREFSRLMDARDRPSSRASRSPQTTRRACCRRGTEPYSVNGGLHDAVRSRQTVFAGNLPFSQSYLMAKALRAYHQQAGLDGHGT